MIYSANLNRKQPTEKGPFGRATNRRSMSRSKTATPATKDDLAKIEEAKVIDSIFTSFKRNLEEKENKAPSLRESKGGLPSGRLPHSQSAMDLTAPMSSGPAGPGASTYKEPTEVLLHGFSSEYQYAAIEFYENTSGGRIYEDYDRYPPNPRFNTFLTTTARSAIPRTLPPAALRKINTYQGGDHWIKVTFDSPEAAERACYYSPHIIHGYACYAELWRGAGPNADVAINANAANGGSGAESMRQRRPSERRQPSQEGQRKSSTMPSRIHSAPSLFSQPNARGTSSGNDAQALQAVNEDDEDAGSEPQNGQAKPQSTPPPKPLRIQGAKRAVLLPASDALLPVAPWSQRTFGHLPIVGSLVGGDTKLANTKLGDMTITVGVASLGAVVPRKENGNFDWDRAGWYWRICWLLDWWCGTDLCGLKGEE
jgi:hypothetical protein